MTDWKTIVDQHGGLVWRTIVRLVGDCADASDAFQETFLEAVKASRREAIRDWPAMLRHLAIARALDLLRVRYRNRRRTEALVDPDVLIGREAGPEQNVEARELAERLRAALAQLSSQQAEVFCLVCLDQFSYSETAERLHMTTNAVGVLLNRARGRLRELLVPFDAGVCRDDRGLEA